ncbi:MAG: SGNH/GDSL hydrolase family protein [Eubacterium sp.]|nr:SGNH/GDSL hydrolase family protein [Eubacterium sp.]
MNLKHKANTTQKKTTASANRNKKTYLLPWLCILMLSVSILHPAAAQPLIVHAAGTGGIKGNNLPAGYVTEQQMKLANPWTDTNEMPLFNVMRKAQSGQRVTIALIGGSITKGTMSTGTRDESMNKKLTYFDYFTNWWYKTFPKADLLFVNAGISATDSYLGVHRVQKDVLDRKPDLVLVEFAVNDKKTAYHRQAYENLVRKILDSPTKPAVMLLFMSKLNGWSCQLQQAKIGSHYHLPMLSYANVMKDMIGKGIYTMEELSGDAIHPSALGSAVIGEILVRYLDSIQKKSLGQVSYKKVPSTYVTSKKYGSAKLLSCKDIKIQRMGTFERSSKSQIFPDNLTTGSGNGDLTFTVTGKNIGILFAQQINGRGGQFDVYVDGKKTATIDADNSGGRHNKPGSVPCYSSNTKKTHTVRIVRNQKSSGRALTIYGVLVSN